MNFIVIIESIVSLFIMIPIKNDIMTLISLSV